MRGKAWVTIGVAYRKLLGFLFCEENSRYRKSAIVFFEWRWANKTFMSDSDLKAVFTSKCALDAVPQRL